MTDKTDKPVAPKADPVAEKPAIVAAADPSILSEEDKAQLRASARKKVAEEIRKAALKAQLDEYEREERIAAGIFDKPELPKGRWPEYGAPPCAEEDKVQITIALPPFADCIVIDGRMFFDGHTEWVSPAVYASLIDQMQMSWAHQDNNQIVSPRDKFRQRSRGRDAHLMMGAVKVNTAGSLN